MTKTTKPNAVAQPEDRLLTEEEIRAMGDDDYMNPAQLAFFKNRLQELEKELLKNAGETTEHLRETVLVPDPADRATIEEEHALELRTRDRERKLLKKVQQSLACDRLRRLRLVRRNRRADRHPAPDRASDRHPVAGSPAAPRTEAKALRRLIPSASPKKACAAPHAFFFCPARTRTPNQILALSDTLLSPGIACAAQVCAPCARRAMLLSRPAHAKRVRRILIDRNDVGFFLS
jgi:RNA polymerase-binding protein DksA